ncbi:MAG TPA: hypothetical protein VMW32_03700 [Bacteroidales bacterium]|nr:hypothetical protein [Bacteroidales bacterium]
MIKVEFQNNPKLYNGKHLEIRNTGSQIRFYEVGKKEYCLAKDTVTWLVHVGSLPRTRIMRQALKGDKTIFN